MKFTVTQAQNGWIVSVKQYGQPRAMEAIPQLFIFYRLSDLVAWVESQRVGK